MLADHVRMNVLGVDAAVAAEKTAEAGGIQSRTRPQHPPGRDAAIAGVPCREMRHHVYRIGRHNQHGVRRMFQHRRDDLVEDLRVALTKLEASLSGLLTDAGADHDYPTAGEVLVSTRANLERVRKRHGVPNIVSLGSGPSFVLVYQDDLAPDALHHQRVAGRCPNKPGAYNTDFHKRPLVTSDE
jgi:hypothetical protein